MFANAMNPEPTTAVHLRVIVVAIPSDLLLRVDEMVLAAKARGEPWGRSEMLTRALEAYLGNDPHFRPVG